MTPARKRTQASARARPYAVKAARAPARRATPFFRARASAVAAACALCFTPASLGAQTDAVPREIRVELEAAVPAAAPEDEAQESEQERRSSPLLQRALEAGITEAVRRAARALQDPELLVAPETAAPPPRALDAGALLAAARAQLLTGSTNADAQPAPEEETDVLTKLESAPQNYALRYSVLEVLGNRPRAPADEAPEPGAAVHLQHPGRRAPETSDAPRPGAAAGPGLQHPGRRAPETSEASKPGAAHAEPPAQAHEFALRLEVYVDGPRLADALSNAGLRTRRDPAKTPALRVVLSPAPDWRALQSFREAALAQGAARVTPEVFEASQIVLQLFAPEPQRLLAHLAQHPPQGLQIQIHDSTPERLLLELSPAPEGAAAGGAEPASPEALPGGAN